MTVAETNWAGNHVYRAQRVARPRTVDELRALVVGASAVRPLGSRHSFNALADTDDLLLSTVALPELVRVDPDARTVTVGGGMRYGAVADQLHRAGWALPNLASLPHISVAGAVATGTHGSGDRNGSLATAVSGLRIMTAAGEEVELRRGEEGFDGAVVSLGALGVVTEMTLDVVPTFDVHQRLFGHVPWDVVVERFDEVSASAYSVSLFTTWHEDTIGLAWLKEVADGAFGESFFGAAPLTEQRHMLADQDPRHTTVQLGVAGPWHERLPHFRPEFTPSSGAEIQSEYLVPRAHAREAILAMRDLGPRLAGVLQVGEIRTVAADELWLSSAYGTDVVGFHLTWRPDQAAVAAVLPAIEGELFPLGARPHWGKVYVDRDRLVPGMYPRLEEFGSLAARFDPRGVFRNAMLRGLLEG
ncbi:FAD-binding protein [Luteipulveratus sp. YIM 133296]|uniref:FAD-binding protein n=1 Tax=Luteipulveratus flavus TaxID=3031728 RepID=A0ABT6CBF1_9MICO|nr:FAD-binding protein [Luteipulveratus sp. YIM 133296]MDF8266227.1 FAD-binding protein [Luteipulveratus sp. YIM 133296]